MRTPTHKKGYFKLRVKKVLFLFLWEDGDQQITKEGKKERDGKFTVCKHSF